VEGPCSGLPAWTVRGTREPLAALDDDGDGRLEGAELDGLAVWRATGLEDGVPANPRGLGLRDGTTRPTCDWTPSPAAGPHGGP
jgi:hypothetical protein